MGYTTKFQGVLKFSPDVTVDQIREVKKYYGVDSRVIEPSVKHEWYYMQFMVTRELDGIEWDGGEKFYGAVEAVNWLVAKVRETFPGFTLNGELLAQGEEPEDRWTLLCKDGVASRIDLPVIGVRAQCPECGHCWIIEEPPK